METGLTTRRVTIDEARKHGITAVLEETEWFLDERAQDVPTISLISTGISFNAVACEKYKLAADTRVQLGYKAAERKLIVKFGTEGILLRKPKDRAGLIGLSPRFVQWLKARGVTPKKYAIRNDEGVLYAEVETKK